VRPGTHLTQRRRDAEAQSRKTTAYKRKIMSKTKIRKMSRSNSRIKMRTLQSDKRFRDSSRD